MQYLFHFMECRANFSSWTYTTVVRKLKTKSPVGISFLFLFFSYPHTKRCVHKNSELLFPIYTLLWFNSVKNIHFIRSLRLIRTLLLLCICVWFWKKITICCIVLVQNMWPRLDIDKLGYRRNCNLELPSLVVNQLFMSFIFFPTCEQKK